MPDRPGPKEGGPSLPAPGQVEKRLQELESRVQVIETLFKKLNNIWPQIEQKLLQSQDPKVQQLAAQLGQLRQELASSVQKVKEEARKTAQKENADLKAKLAELAGQVVTLQQMMGLVRDYVAARKQGQSPKGALAQALDAKLQAMEKRLQARVENLDRGSLATALTWVGVPSVAATIIAFFLAGALRSRLSGGLELMLSRIHERLDAMSGNSSKQ